MLEELLFFYCLLIILMTLIKQPPPHLDQTQMRSKNPWFDLLAGCYKFVYPLSETGTFIQDSADPLLQYIIYGSWAASYYVFLP